MLRWGHPKMNWVCTVTVVRTSYETTLSYPLFFLLTCIAIDDLDKVTDYLLDLGNTDIHNLGITLGLHFPHLKTMRDSEIFRDEVIAAWLQKEDQVTKKGVPTWETLVKALRNHRVNQTGVADKIETDKCVAQWLAFRHASPFWYTVAVLLFNVYFCVQ